MSPSSFDQRELRNALETFVTGVTVVTTLSFVDEDLRLSHSVQETEAAQRAMFEEEVALARESGIARAVNPEPSPIHRVAVNAFSEQIREA